MSLRGIKNPWCLIRFNNDFLACGDSNWKPALLLVLARTGLNHWYQLIHWISMGHANNWRNTRVSNTCQLLNCLSGKNRESLIIWLAIHRPCGDAGKRWCIPRENPQKPSSINLHRWMWRTFDPIWIWAKPNLPPHLASVLVPCVIRGDREPHGPALVLLNVVKKNHRPCWMQPGI